MIETHTTDNELHDFIQPTCEEYYDDTDDKHGVSRPVEDEKPYGGWEGCWGGDGSGMDDLADYNSMEGMDY